jgi:hypothetical protein
LTDLSLKDGVPAAIVFTPGSALYKSWAQWLMRQGPKPTSSSNFKTQLIEAKFKHIRSREVRGFVGIALKVTATQEDGGRAQGEIPFWIGLCPVRRRQRRQVPYPTSGETAPLEAVR